MSKVLIDQEWRKGGIPGWNNDMNKRLQMGKSGYFQGTEKGYIASHRSMGISEKGPEK